MQLIFAPTPLICNLQTFLLSFTLILSARASPDPLIITPLPDGVTVSGSESLRQMVASWDVFVTLDPPAFPQDLLDHLNSLDHTFGALTQRDLSDTAPRARRDHMKQALLMSTPHSRVKRGLLDIGGSILHSLFGVATDAQLSRFRDALVEVSHSQSDMSHANTQLATVVNQTRTYLKAVALTQTQMSQRMYIIHRTLNKVAEAQRSHEARIHQLELTAALDHYLDIVQLSVDHYTAQVALFNRQKASLEQGHLSRDLLSPDQLQQILAQAATAHEVVDHIEWYYSYVSVTPLWRKAENLLYKVELPLIAPRPYLLYNVASYPVPISNSTLSVALHLQRHYAIDTVSGNIFIPTQCLGHGPVICNTGPEYGPSLLKCARGLITARETLIKSCKVAISDYAGLPQVATMALNQYALSTQGEMLTVRCPGRPENHITLALGTYNITCLDHCTMQGNGYHITCVNRLFLAKRYTMAHVRATAHFNFSTAVKVDLLREALPQLEEIDTQPIRNLDIAMLMNPPQPASIPPVKPRPSILAIINVSTILFIVISLTITYWRYRLNRRKTASILDDDMPSEALPLTAAASQNVANNTAVNLDPTAHVACIWPKLPTISQCYTATHDAAQS